MLSLDHYDAENTCIPCEPHVKPLQNFGNTCSVCLEDEQDMMLLPCAHKFHGECILPWVETNFSCPMCRVEIGQFLPLNGQIDPLFMDIWNQHYIEGIVASSESEDDYDEFVKKDTSTAPEDLDLWLENFDDLLAEVECMMIADLEEENKILSTLTPKLNPRHTVDLALTKSMMALRCNPSVISLSSLKHYFQQFQTCEKTVCETSLTKPAAYQYKTIDNFRAGACSGLLTTVGRMLVERQGIRNLFPVFREVTPNVAIYFTVFEESKRYLGRPSDSYKDIFHQTFLSGFAGGFCAYLPRTHFNALVPLQFGLHFGVFEVAKQGIRNNFHRDRLTVPDVAATAVLGGFLGSCVTFPLGIMYSAGQMMLAGDFAIPISRRALGHEFICHCTRMTPLWATTACGFEFSRRLITNT